MQVKDSRALITGGASGLGLGAARRLMTGGARVALLDVDEQGGADAVAELGDLASFVLCDVSDPENVAASVDRIGDELGGIDILVSAAGVASAQRVVSRDGELFDLERFKYAISVNLVGMFDVIRNVAGLMASNEPGPEGERGVMINVASIAAFEGQVGQVAYSASKGGIVGMTLPLARDLAGMGVRVMTIAPGIMDTPLLGEAPQELKDSLAKLSVFPQRLGTPEDFGALVQAIVENPMLNGEVIRLDAAARMPPR